MFPLESQFLVEQIIWQNHDFKYGPYSATEVKKFRKNIWRAK